MGRTEIPDGMFLCAWKCPKCGSVAMPEDKDPALHEEDDTMICCTVCELCFPWEEILVAEWTPARARFPQEGEPTAEAEKAQDVPDHSNDRFDGDRPACEGDEELGDVPPTACGTNPDGSFYHHHG